MVIRIPNYRQATMLGISFAKKNSQENKIEVMEWNLPESNFKKIREKVIAKCKRMNQSDNSKIQISKKEVLKQVLSGLNSINQDLGTDYQLSKIYYVPSEDGADRIYETFTRMLIRHYHNGNEFIETV